MKTTPRLITARLLRARSACADQVTVFHKTFPVSAAARKVYNEAKAAAFYRAWKSQKSTRSK